MKKYKVAILPRTSETLMNKPPKNVEVFYLVGKDSREENWIRKFLPENNIITYDTEEPSSKYSMEGLMKRTNILDVLKENDINTLLVSTAYSEYKDQWGKENNINLLYVDYEKQSNYENKLWIDAFLKENNIPSPKSFVYKYSRDKYNVPIKGKVVLQIAESIGNDGTFILDSIEEVEKHIKDESIDPDKEYLLREFIEGSSYSIDLFIGPDIAATSLARRQCFYQTKKFNFFNGVQFMPTKTFSPKLIENINKTYKRLAELLHKDNYLGYADFDFMVDKNDDIYILECNARYTTASPHLIHFDEIFSGVPTSTIFWKSFFEKTPFSDNFTFHGYPDLEFQGSVLRILSNPHSDEEELTVKKEFDIGLYQLDNGEIQFKSPDVRQQENNEKDFIYYCDIGKGQKYAPIRFVAELFTTFPVYDDKGKVNEKGLQLLNKFNMF